VSLEVAAQHHPEVPQAVVTVEVET